MKEKHHFEITSMALHIMAMGFMLCDHIWVTIISGNEWMTCLGRIAFPIFAFLTVEGYFHTKNLKKYVLRLFLFALISEVPFNLMVGNSLLFPLHQNVLWTFLISILVIHLLEKAKQQDKLWVQIPAFAGALLIGCILGFVSFVDYGHAGVFMVLTFYLFRKRNWKHFLGQFLLLAYLNIGLLGGQGYDITVFGHPYFVPRQSFAMLALIPIWLYRGKQGPYNRALQYVYYGFYPVHLLILGLLQMFR